MQKNIKGKTREFEFFQKKTSGGTGRRKQAEFRRSAAKELDTFLVIGDPVEHNTG